MKEVTDFKRFDGKGGIVHNGKFYPVGFGSEDRVNVYDSDGDILVLSENSRIGYLGLVGWNSKGNPIIEVFLRGEDVQWFDNLSNLEIIDKLAEDGYTQFDVHSLKPAYFVDQEELEYW